MNFGNTFSFTRRSLLVASALALLAPAAGCGSSNNVSNEQNAHRAYLGLDLAVDKAINLGMQGFNMASNANIPPQTGAGGTSGTLTVSGHVDAGASSNKTMNINTAFSMYADPVHTEDDAGTLHIVYDTNSASLPLISQMLNNIPSTAGAMGTFSGTWTGDVTMSGDLEGTVTLNLSFNGNIRLVAGSTTQIERVPGTTHITGTVTSQYGSYTVDITR